MRLIKRIRWPEQIEHVPWAPASASYRKVLKWLMRKARRRDGKLNTDLAEKQNRYRGWEY